MNDFEAATAALNKASVTAGKATLFALAESIREEYPDATVAHLSESDQGDWLIVMSVDTPTATDLGFDDNDGYASNLYSDVYVLRLLYHEYDVRGQIDYTPRMGITSFELDIAKVLAECGPPPKDEEPERGSEGEARAVLDGIEVIITRSAGTDGAYVVFIDTDFEPDGSNGSPGLRVNINDHPTYVGKPLTMPEDDS